MLQFTIFFIIQRLTHIFLWFTGSCSNILFSGAFQRIICQTKAEMKLRGCFAVVLGVEIRTLLL